VVSGAYEKASAGAHLIALAQDAFDRDKDCSAIFLWIGHVNAVRLPPPLPKPAPGDRPQCPLAG
jgi:hypothetical protein